MQNAPVLRGFGLRRAVENEGAHNYNVTQLGLAAHCLAFFQMINLLLVKNALFV
jgi:hypothetical protein